MVYRTFGSCAEMDRSVDDGTLARELCCVGVKRWEWKDLYGRTRTVFGPLRNGNAAGRWEGVVCSWRDFEKRSKGDEVLGKGRQGNGSSLDVGSLGACPSISEVARGCCRRCRMTLSRAPFGISVT